MLEKPDIDDSQLIAAIHHSFDCEVRELAFLPIGADPYTAAYRASTGGAGELFVKLRKNNFEPASVTIPKLLANAGLSAVIPPLSAVNGQAFTRINEFAMVVYPFIGGVDGFTQSLTSTQWEQLGRTMRALHEFPLANEQAKSLPRERFHATAILRARELIQHATHETFDDPDAKQLAKTIKQHHEVLIHVLDRADALREVVLVRKWDHVLCHGDIHAGNVLLEPGGAIYVVDWDTMCLAPRERDLMFIGAGIVQSWNTEAELEAFYRGYGEFEVDEALIAYYRYERIAQDIVEFCEQLLLTDAGGADREQSLRFFAGQFELGDVIDVAIRTDPGTTGSGSPPTQFDSSST